MNLIETLSRKELESINLKKISKGEVLFNEGDICDSIGIVKFGELKIASFLETGKEVVYNDISENQIFGNNLLFSSDPFYRGDVIAKADSEVYLIKKDILVQILQSNQKFLLSYLEEQSNFGKKLNLNIKLLTFNSAKERILYYLSINKNKISYKSVTDLANKLFLTREATSREIHCLEKEKIIKITPRAIVKI